MGERSSQGYIHDDRLNAVVATIADGLILIDGAGSIVLFNPACERLFGYRVDEVLGQNVRMLMPAPYQDQHDGYLAAYAATRIGNMIGAGRELEGRRKDGTIFPMELSVGEMWQDGGSMFVGVVRDLTERKMAEQEIRESAARLRAVVDTAVDGVILIDSRGEVLKFNPACERLFGYPESEVVGRNVKLLMPEHYRERHDGFVRNYVESGVPRIIGIGREVIGQRKDGSTFPLDLSVGEAKQDGTSIFVGIIHDLTARKQTDERLLQAQKMEAVGKLSGGIAHDFNNLLTVMIGNAEFLADELEDHKALKNMAEMIISAGERGAALIQHLLTYSRRQVLQPVEVDCNALLNNLLEILHRTLREDVELSTLLEQDIWCVQIDPVQLESAVLNLVLNAQDALPAGGGIAIETANLNVADVSPDARHEVQPGSYVMISITDNGVGMSQSVRERAFEPFFTTKDIGKGSGLGLSMVYGFVKQSNGHLALDSEPGHGTTVRIYLPALISASPQSTGQAPISQLGVNRGTVLVTEDDPFVRAYTVSCLEALDFQVIAAANGHDALARLSEHGPVDLLLSDVVMPGGMNGLELVERARQFQPELKVLLMSGYALDAFHTGNGLQDELPLLSKPYRKTALIQAMSKVLDDKIQVKPPG